MQCALAPDDNKAVCLTCVVRAAHSIQIEDDRKEWASKYLSQFDLKSINDMIARYAWMMADPGYAKPFSNMESVLAFNEHKSHICKYCGVAWHKDAKK
jgi:hypothetical protein